MRQIRQRTARATRPTPDTTRTQLPARPVVRNWLDRLDPSTDPGRVRPTRLASKGGEPMTKLRQFATWLVLVSAPMALLLIETAGLRHP